MALISLQILVVLPLWVSLSQTAVTSFTRSQSTGLSHLGECCLITRCNQSPRQFLSLKMCFSWFGLPYSKKLWQCCKRLLQATAGMCVSQWWKFWRYNVITHIADTDSYGWLNVMWCDLFFTKKFREFYNKLNWIVKCWRVLLVLFIRVSSCMDQHWCTCSNMVGQHPRKFPITQVQHKWKYRKKF